MEKKSESYFWGGLMKAVCRVYKNAVMLYKWVQLVKYNIYWPFIGHLYCMNLLRLITSVLTAQDNSKVYENLEKALEPPILHLK